MSMGELYLCHEQDCRKCILSVNYAYGNTVILMLIATLLTMTIYSVADISSCDVKHEIALHKDHWYMCADASILIIRMSVCL